MEFKVDENLPFEACLVLRAAGHDAVSVLEQRLGGRPDADLAAVCRAESRILVTLDIDFASILAHPPQESPGIVVIRTNDQAKPTVLGLVQKMAAALTSESPARRLWIVEHDRIRVRGAD